MPPLVLNLLLRIHELILVQGVNKRLKYDVLSFYLDPVEVLGVTLNFIAIVHDDGIDLAHLFCLFLFICLNKLP
jgi:hypothetical protein